MLTSKSSCTAGLPVRTRAGQWYMVTAGHCVGNAAGVPATTSLNCASPGLAARTISALALVEGICVNPGDSRSPVYAGCGAIGIVVARSATGCYTWYTKLPAQLEQRDA